MEIELIVIVAMILLSATFSATEAAILSVNRLRLKYLKNKYPNSPQIASLLRIKTHTSRTIMAILVGNNVANISASVLVAHITTTYYGDVYLGIATAILTLVILIVGEIIPKNYATSNSDSVAVFMAQPIEVLTYAIGPIIFVLEKISAPIVGNQNFISKKPHFSEAEIRSVLEIGVEDRAISKDEKILLERVLDFNDTSIQEIMTPKKQVKTMNYKDTVENALKKVGKYRKNRYPVIDENNKPVGVISQREMLSSQKEQLISQIMVEPYFVSKETVAYELFRNLQRNKRQMAIVIATDGTIEGIVTMEDLLEEIVGEIEERPSGIEQQHWTKSELIVSGDARLHDVEKELGISFEQSQRFGSVGAYIQYQLRRLPAKHDTIITKSIRIEITEVSKDFSNLKVKFSKIGK